MIDLTTVQPKVRQCCSHRHPGGKARQSVKQAWHISAQLALIIQNAQLWQVMSAADLKVHWVVTWCDLHRSWEVKIDD